MGVNHPVTPAHVSKADVERLRPARSVPAGHGNRSFVQATGRSFGFGPHDETRASVLPRSIPSFVTSSASFHPDATFARLATHALAAVEEYRKYDVVAFPADQPDAQFPRSVHGRLYGGDWEDKLLLLGMAKDHVEAAEKVPLILVTLRHDEFFPLILVTLRHAVHVKFDTSAWVSFLRLFLVLQFDGKVRVRDLQLLQPVRGFAQGEYHGAVWQTPVAWKDGNTMSVQQTSHLSFRKTGDYYETTNKQIVDAPVK